MTCVTVYLLNDMELSHTIIKVDVMYSMLPNLWNGVKYWFYNKKKVHYEKPTMPIRKYTGCSECICIELILPPYNAGKNTPITVSIFNIRGQRVWQGVVDGNNNFTKVKIPLTGAGVSLYLLRLNVGGVVLARKKITIL